jgi:NAD(P)-dependent dehydrogenase (short-subunit alcohol dehydrogenase family)
MDLELRDKAFLITGGTDGLGLALARRLIEEGANVAICGRDEQRLEEARTSLGADALCVRTDVTVASELDAFIDAALERFGRLDGAVNNAGKSSSSSVAESTDDLWRSDYELKVIAALHVSRRVLPSLEANGGAIVNVLAIGARAPGANSAPTTASRAGRARECRAHRTDRVRPVGAPSERQQRGHSDVLRRDGEELENSTGATRAG